MNAQKIVSREEWTEARKALLVQEKELTRARDRLAEARRALPWVKLDKDYVFDGPNGKVSLADLFDGRSQLLVQHVMLAPGSQDICTGCAFGADHVDAARQHFENADLSYAAVSRAEPEHIAAVARRMGWKFNWVSSGNNSFNYDFGVSFTPEQLDNGTAEYNYAPLDFRMEDLHGMSVFAKNDAGEIFHTYSTYARGSEAAMSAFAFLDMVPKSRNEDGIMSWVRLHDEYEGGGSSCCHAA